MAGSYRAPSQGLALPAEIPRATVTMIGRLRVVFGSFATLVSTLTSCYFAASHHNHFTRRHRRRKKGAMSPRSQIQKPTSRLRPVSCHFCRSRKLRCSRQLPCSNCISRGIDCGLYSPLASIDKPQNSNSHETADILTRLKRLEEIVLPTDRQSSRAQDPKPDRRRSRPQLERKDKQAAADAIWLEAECASQVSCVCVLSDLCRGP